MLNKYDLVSYYAADDDSDIILNLFSQYHTPFTVMYYMYALSNIKKNKRTTRYIESFFSAVLSCFRYLRNRQP